MNHYLVIWKPEAERRLNAIWRLAADPNRILSAAVELERRLRSDPHSEGESREDDGRITFEAPLGIRFRIVDKETVLVLMAWNTERQQR